MQIAYPIVKRFVKIVSLWATTEKARVVMTRHLGFSSKLELIGKQLQETRLRGEDNHICLLGVCLLITKVPREAKSIVNTPFYHVVHTVIWIELPAKACAARTASEMSKSRPSG